MEDPVLKSVEGTFKVYKCTYAFFDLLAKQIVSENFEFAILVADNKVVKDILSTVIEIQKSLRNNIKSIT